MISVELAFLNEMRARGLDPAETPIADGKLHRIRDRRDKPGKIDLWYRLYDDGFPSGCFGHWSRSPETQKWQSNHDRALSPKERRLMNKLHEQRRAAAELAMQQLQAACRNKAESMLAAAGDASHNHKYLIRKHVKAYGIKQLKDMLLIPLYKGGSLTGLQTIMPDGAKTFLRGSVKAGAYFTIPGKGPTIYIVEGYATGATIHELTGSRVVVAFDCWNLEAVAKAVKVAHPECGLVVCADNDRLTSGNPGLTKARAAALATGAKLAIPTFPGDEGSDFNDMVAIINGVGGTPCQL